MKILFVGMYPDEFNPYRNVFFQNLIYAMADEGVSCTVISPIPITKYRFHTKMVPHQKIEKTKNGAEVKIYYPRYISLSSKKIGTLNSGIWSERLFQHSAVKCAKHLEMDFDAVYGHFFLSGGLAAVRIGREKNIPTFIAYGECNYETEVIKLYKEIEGKEVDGLAGIIAVSSNNAKVLKEKKIYDGIPMIVAPNAVDISLFHPMDKLDCREKFKIPKDTFIVGFVGGFEERKGDKRLLAALNSLEGIYGAFAGKGEKPPSGKNVVFCKALKHEEIPMFLNAVDIFCLPTQNEGSCNALVEAAACGKAIISSDLPFNDDLLNDNNSIRINPNSIDEIREAIRKLYSQKDYRFQIEEEAYNASRKFDIRTRAKNILNFINSGIESEHDK